MKNKHVGLLIIAIVILFFIIVMSFNNALETIVNTSCTHGASCPMQATLDTQKTISYTLMSLLLLIGIYIAFFMKNKKELIKEPIEINLENLQEEEKNIVNILQRDKGSTYQSDLIKETNLTKVRITRILDKLEGKGLIERKRRGMTNIIILK
tara:strand:- start:260 stop:718 length:459 start_codon:yes stop_codon:yes gene_type:complete